jgi:hypothetical protein
LELRAIAKGKELLNDWRMPRSKYVASAITGQQEYIVSGSSIASF